MTVAKLLSGTIDVIPLTAERWKTRVIRIEGKSESEKFNTVTYRALSFGGTVGSGVYILHVMFSEPGLGAQAEPKPSSRANVRVKCSCLAYQYWFANANWGAQAFWGNPSKWTKVASVRNNPRHIPGMCKHQVALMWLLYKQGEIKIAGSGGAF